MPHCTIDTMYRIIHKTNNIPMFNKDCQYHQLQVKTVNWNTVNIGCHVFFPDIHLCFKETLTNVKWEPWKANANAIIISFNKKKKTTTNVISKSSTSESINAKNILLEIEPVLINAWRKMTISQVAMPCMD